jgi:hypothetical protein
MIVDSGDIRNRVDDAEVYIVGMRIDTTYKHTDHACWA